MYVHGRALSGDFPFCIDRFNGLVGLPVGLGIDEGCDDGRVTTQSKTAGV